MNYEALLHVEDFNVNLSSRITKIEWRAAARRIQHGDKLYRSVVCTGCDCSTGMICDLALASYYVTQDQNFIYTMQLFRFGFLCPFCYCYLISVMRNVWLNFICNGGVFGIIAVEMFNTQFLAQV
jgi:hypothetical protein